MLRRGPLLGHQLIDTERIRGWLGGAVLACRQLRLVFARGPPPAGAVFLGAVFLLSFRLLLPVVTKRRRLGTGRSLAVPRENVGGVSSLSSGQLRQPGGLGAQRHPLYKHLAAE
jgi:hypothetical protein